MSSTFSQHRERASDIGTDNDEPFGFIELLSTVAGFDAQADATDAALGRIGEQAAQHGASDALAAPWLVERHGQLWGVCIDEAITRITAGR